MTLLKNRLTTAKVAWEPRFYNPDLAKWLHRISVPTLILWGETDKVMPPAYGPAYQALIPGSKLEIVRELRTPAAGREGRTNSSEAVTSFIEEAA